MSSQSLTLMLSCYLIMAFKYKGLIFVKKWWDVYFVVIFVIPFKKILIWMTFHVLHHFLANISATVAFWFGLTFAANFSTQKGQVYSLSNSTKIAAMQIIRSKMERKCHTVHRISYNLSFLFSNENFLKEIDMNLHFSWNRTTNVRHKVVVNFTAQNTTKGRKKRTW